MDFRERLTANAEDFDGIVSEILAENESLKAKILAANNGELNVSPWVAELATSLMFANVYKHYELSRDQLFELMGGTVRVASIAALAHDAAIAKEKE